MSFKYCATLRATKIVSMVDCELDLNAVLSDNSAGGGPALLFVNVFYNQLFVRVLQRQARLDCHFFCQAGATWASANLKQTLLAPAP